MSSRSTPSPRRIPRRRFIPISTTKPHVGQGLITGRLAAGPFATACGAADGIQLAVVLAAGSAATGAMSAVIMPTLNTEVVNLFLAAVLRESPPGVCCADLARGGLRPHR